MTPRFPSDAYVVTALDLFISDSLAVDWSANNINSTECFSPAAATDDAVAAGGEPISHLYTRFLPLTSPAHLDSLLNAAALLII